MSRKASAKTIEIVEAELFSSKPSIERIGVIRCYDFAQAPDKHIRKLDGTEVTEAGSIRFKFESTFNLKEDAKFLIQLAGEKDARLVSVECDGFTLDLGSNIYQARCIEPTLA